VLYMTFRYGWNESMIGITMAIIGGCTMVVQGFLIQKFVTRFGERAALYVGLAFGVAGFAGFGLAPTGQWFWAAIPVLALWGLAGAAILALMSRRVSATEQGQLQGANASLVGIANMIGPVIFATSYARAIGPDHGFNLPGAPFLVAAAILGIALFVGMYVMRERA